MTASTREALLYAAKREVDADRLRYLEIENSALRAKLKALEAQSSKDKVFAVSAENAGLRQAVEALRNYQDLAKDLAAKGAAVREECAKAAEARGYPSFAKELRSLITDSQRRVTDGTT